MTRLGPPGWKPTTRFFTLKYAEQVEWLDENYPLEGGR